MSQRKLLRIDTSSAPATSASRQLCDLIVAHLGTGDPTIRDLAAHPLPVVSADWISGRMKPPADRTGPEADELVLSETLIGEIMAADTLVIGVPIYNFGIPASLKAWIDLIVVPGLTVQFTAQGVTPLVHGKRVILAVASASTGVGSDSDFATTYMRRILGFIGMTEVELVVADQLAFGRDAALARAGAQVAALPV